MFNQRGKYYNYRSVAFDRKHTTTELYLVSVWPEMLNKIFPPDPGITRQDYGENSLQAICVCACV